MSKTSLSIAMLCESFGALGGVPQIVEDLSAEFVSAGHRIAIVSNPIHTARFVRPPNPAVEQVWVDLPRSRPAGWRHPERWFRSSRAAQLAEFIARWHPDVLNVHGGLRDRFPAVVQACQSMNVPLVLSFHLPEAFPPGADAGRVAALTQNALRAARVLTFQSNAVKERFKELSAEAKRGKVIRGGVTLAAASRATPYERERPFVFSASRLDLTHKAIDTLIEAFCLVAPDFSEVDLLIAGDGPARPQIAALIHASGFSARIELLPAQPHEQIWSFYKGAMLFAMLSRKPEGLGLAFLEAMACERPVVGTRSGGTPEVVVHGQHGLLVDRNEPAEIAEAIRHLLEHGEERQQMGRRGYQMAQTCDWRIVAPQYLNLYRDLLV